MAKKSASKSSSKSAPKKKTAKKKAAKKPAKKAAAKKAPAKSKSKAKSSKNPAPKPAEKEIDSSLAHALEDEAAASVSKPVVSVGEGTARMGDSVRDVLNSVGTEMTIEREVPADPPPNTHNASAGSTGSTTTFSQPVYEENRRADDDEDSRALLSKRIVLRGPSDLDRAVFCRELATLLEVGIPLLTALQMLGRRTAHPQLAKAIREVAEDIQDGDSVGEAMEKRESVFSSLIVNLIQIGERGGILVDTLKRLANVVERKAEIKRRVRWAAAYPIIVSIIAILAIWIIILKAVPLFSDVFAQSEAELPWPTKVLEQMSIFLSNFWLIIIPLIIILVALIIVFFKTDPGKRTSSWLALHFPLIRGVGRKLAVARFTRTLSSLLSAGVPMIESLEIAADANENVIISEEIMNVRDSVEEGNSFTRPIERSGVFPLMVVDMIAVGEETGTLDQMLEKTADIYDAEVDETLRGLSSIIEPIFIVLLGGVVLFIMLAVLWPYFTLANTIEI